MKRTILIAALAVMISTPAFAAAKPKPVPTCPDCTMPRPPVLPVPPTPEPPAPYPPIFP